MNRINLDLKKMIPKGCELELSDSTLKATPGEDGFVRLRLEGDAGRVGGYNWGERRYLVVDLLADMDSQVLVDFCFEKPGDTPEDSTGLLNYELLPNRRIKWVVEFEDMQSRKFFLLTLPGMLKGRARCNPFDINDVTALELRVHPGYSHRFSSFTIFEAYLTDTLPDLTVIGEPMADELGQWTAKDWSTKAHSEADMKSYLLEEHRHAEVENSYPEGWSRFGGWKKLRFDATGYFHTHHDGNRWWLVDPEGYAFFSNGMCYGSRMGVHGFTDRMENLFSWLPDYNDPTYRDAWTTADHIAEYVKRNGTENGKSRRMFNFARANMIRTFGADGWWDAWVRINGARLKRWGFNTIGVGVNNYDDERAMDYLKAVEIPFVWTIKDFPLTDELIFRDFPDVYSPQYAERSRLFARQLEAFKGNPYMIGYFVTNEPEWRFQSVVNLAERVFAHPARLCSKEALIALLREKYGDIATLNSAWHTGFVGFDALYTPFEHADRLSPSAAEDMQELRRHLLKKYSLVPRDALRKVDPDHMNLGLRYNRINANELPGSEYFDILSFNCYFPSAEPSIEVVETGIDMPTMIGEWHIGGGDKGLLSCGLLTSATQEERGRACEYYMQGAMRHKSCVGIHYFEMNDQPLLGRFDGECMQHGVIDVCNRSYDELTEHFTNTARHMYEYVSGQMEMTAEPAEVYRAR